MNNHSLKYQQRTVSPALEITDLPPFRTTPKAQEILDVLHSAGEWMSRSGLAVRLQKSALNKWDIVLLGKLLDAGLIEARQIRHHGPIGYEWQYRVVPIDQA